jgi:hypothetical protein
MCGAEPRPRLSRLSINGPYEVIECGPKFFKICLGCRVKPVSVDRLKPHLGAAATTPAEPPRRGLHPAAPDVRSYAQVVTGGGGGMWRPLSETRLMTVQCYFADYCQSSVYFELIHRYTSTTWVRSVFFHSTFILIVSLSKKSKCYCVRVAAPRPIRKFA